jgi:hypothetical protein
VRKEGRIYRYKNGSKESDVRKEGRIYRYKMDQRKVT